MFNWYFGVPCLIGILDMYLLVKMNPAAPTVHRHRPLLGLSDHKYLNCYIKTARK